MRLTELLNKDEVTISCELFPPKQGAQLENYKNIVKDMAALKPAYMSVTYGATGGTSDYTVKLAEEVRNNNIPALAHLTCASSTREKVASVIEELKAANIENILALRGDIPANADFPLPDQYKHASELIADIKAQGDFCIGGACYPEGHPEAATIFEDLDHLKEKVDAGCEYLTTQMFFDNEKYYAFVDRCRAEGITVPIIPGIKPIVFKNQLTVLPKIFRSDIPEPFATELRKCKTDDEAKAVGVEWCIQQCKDLIAHGVPSLHFYTMMASDSVYKVAKEVY